jgi:hypothetical protein
MVCGIDTIAMAHLSASAAPGCFLMRVGANLFPFSEYFRDENIIRQLCKARVRLARRRHEDQFFQNITSDLEPRSRSSDSLVVLGNIFPPRREWHRSRPRLDRRRRRSTQNLNVESLLRATLVLRSGSREPWARNLENTVGRIRSRAVSGKRFEFDKPSIRPGEKKRGRHEYRPLVEFPPEDKIIDCLVAKYLRETLDDVLRDSCLAFRCRKSHKAAPTIHDALQKILSVNRRYRKAGLFVAECDIKSFYDCVSHTLVRQSLTDLITQARRKDPSLIVDQRALDIVEAYLRSYSFSRDVHPDGSAASTFLRSRDSKGVYKWPVSDLTRLHRRKSLPQIGVPQGSALSCFVANAVLHSVDQEMERIKRELKRRFTYMRYCDDMILLASDPRICHIAFQRYCRAVRSLRLPIHDPAPVRGYSSAYLRRKFWKSKSNRPYLWARPIGKAVSWIQFLGYQVRYDGLIRVRPRSLKKEFAKLRGAADQMLRILDASERSAIRKNKHEIEHRFRMKLISMAVGRRELGPPLEGPLPMCWTNGFRGLTGRKLVSNGLKALDRHRERQIRRVVRQLESLNLPSSPGKKKPPVHRYYGYPFSYWAQFRRTE